ncbi:hypothetical protein Nepgr_014151 [Nepenthes gracilis]|uniref:Uncharacterized protein n=1 Tax=Nepenthes gracilis TaxID=150966 RepID=A0AAD3SK61_NEPGR|nr:hypothetical protein Nepgr_014151 [Nepenthes gracilis]
MPMSPCEEQTGWGSGGEKWSFQTMRAHEVPEVWSSESLGWPRQTRLDIFKSELEGWERVCRLTFSRCEGLLSHASIRINP